MSLFRDLGRRVERFRQEAEDAADESASHECTDCGAGFHGDREECPECGGRIDSLD